jgi:ATP-dependent helicase HrpB
MQNLPITQVIPEVKELLLTHTKLVLQAPPGAGKTTALPLALLDEPWLEGKKIIMLEPRRLAVRSSASRMAELLGEKVGERVGYQIKMDSMQSKKTQILIVTEGVLTRKLQHDPSLEDVALIIFDEFHERSIHADLSLALALESQAILREDLKILIMSATLNTSAISELLDHAPIVQSEGRAFPVERFYLDPTTPLPTKRELPFYVHKRLLKLLEVEEGNILVFLSGVREIKSVEKLLKESKLDHVEIAPLYGNLTKEAQDRAIKAPPKGRRKVVLATNIAQTSLTIDGIKIVVDSGIQNISVFSPLSGMNKLERQFISQDSATQRAGRAGRLSAGKAYHLWHESKILLKHDVPEILQADLSQLLLDLALWGNESIDEFRWMDTPPPSAIGHAQKLLKQLGALNKQGVITSHGKAMSHFGLHPRLSHMMIKAKELNLEYEASLLCVILTEKDFINSRFADIKERVSLLHDINIHKRVHQKVNIAQAKQMLKTAKKLTPVGLALADKNSINQDKLGLLLAFAYPDRIAQLRHQNRGVYLLSNGKGANLHHEDELFNARFLVVADLDGKSTNATIYKAIELNIADIEEYLTEQIVTQNIVSWSEEQERVEVRRVEKLGAIVLKEMQTNKASDAEIAEVLLAELEELGLDALNWSREALRLRERLDFLAFHGVDVLHRLKPTLRKSDSFSDYLSDNMDVWLEPYLMGKRTLRACKSLDLYPIILGLFNYEEQQTIERLAPKKLKVASGSKIFLDYSNPKQPILAVRLQEMFGTKTTPTILDGKVKLMIHLLSPASRPMQMTQDLESFWLNTYDEVKKELRGKYKKHYWPDDPLDAQATSRTKKRM